VSSDIGKLQDHGRFGPMRPARARGQTGKQGAAQGAYAKDQQKAAGGLVTATGTTPSDIRMAVGANGTSAEVSPSSSRTWPHRERPGCSSCRSKRFAHEPGADLGALGYAWLGSSNLRTGFRRLERDQESLRNSWLRYNGRTPRPGRQPMAHERENQGRPEVGTSKKARVYAGFSRVG